MSLHLCYDFQDSVKISFTMYVPTSTQRRTSLCVEWYTAEPREGERRGGGGGKERGGVKNDIGITSKG